MTTIDPQCPSCTVPVDNGGLCNFCKTYSPPPSDRHLANLAHVRTATGWHKVVRVSAKSVTVETGYSWTDRHPLARIIEVRTIGPAK